MQLPVDRRSAAEDAIPGVLDPRRGRSAGILSEVERRACRRNGIGLAWDPLQDGWVTSACEDDIAPLLEGRPARPRSGPAIALRPWTAADAPRFAALLGDRRVWAFLPDPWPGDLTVEAATTLIALSNEAAHHRVLAVEAEGAPVGQVRLLFDADGRGGEVSYWFGVAHWGRGLASAAVARFTEGCLAEHPAVTRIHARVHEGNAASARVLARAGYVRRPAEDAAPWQVWVRERG